MMNLHQIVLGARVRTLALSVAPVAMGVAAAWHLLRAHGTASAGRTWLLAVLCLAVAAFLQIGANYANDYADGIRGTDAHRGGAGTVDPDDGHVPDYEELHAPVRLVASGVAPRAVLTAAAVSAALACLCGLVATALTGHWWFLALGAICVAAGWCYVGGPHPYGYHGWGGIAAFVFFGPVATVGTTYVMSDTADLFSWAGGVLAGLVALAMIGVNDIRDLDTDREAGKRTLAVRMGHTASLVCLTAMLAMVGVAMLAATIWLGMHGDDNPDIWWSFCAVVGMVAVELFGWFAVRAAWQGEYMRAMLLLSELAIALAVSFAGFALAL